MELDTLLLIVQILLGMGAIHFFFLAFTVFDKWKEKE